MIKVTEELASNQTFKSYVIFWIGQLFSVLGSSISHFAIIWWITDLTGSTMLLSLASFFYILPMTIVVALTGVIIDKWNRKTIIVVVDSLQAYVMLLVIIIFNFGGTNPILIVGIMSLLGIFQGFHIPTVSAIVPTMVPKEKLSRMNGINFFFRSFIQIIGPVIGAMLLSVIPIEIVLWIDPLTYIIAFIPLIITKIPKVQSKETVVKKNSFLEDFKIGIKTLKSIPVVFMMLLISMFVNFLLVPINILMPYFIRYNHSGDASNLAFIITFMNGGMLLGALVTSIKKEWKHALFIYFSLEFVLMMTGSIMAITPYQLYLMLGIISAITGITVPILNTIYLTIMQLKVPADKMGRLSSLDWAISSAITPIAAILTGPLSEIVGVTNLFLSCSILGMIITLLLWWIAHTRVNNNNKKKELEKMDIIIDSIPE
ncbi:MAG: MFS transporter [Promethearchaeota archaeon]|nr:MAG: MFS transporter [Candidatus Lokiarchaeota archaeon]